MSELEKLIGPSVFDTVRNVYYVLILSKELGKAPEELFDSVHQIKNVEISDKRLAKFLFDAFVDCEEQLSFLVLLFKHYTKTKDAFVALAYTLNDMEYGIYKI